MIYRALICNFIGENHLPGSGISSYIPRELVVYL